MGIYVIDRFFQKQVAKWGRYCFAPVIKDAADMGERSRRFGEESMELMQASGTTKEMAHQLVDYVWGRPVGDPIQEVGGVMVTLAYLCEVAGIDMARAGIDELERINQPHITAKIREKQVSKQLHGIGGTPIDQA